MFRQLQLPQNPPIWQPTKLKLASKKISNESLKKPKLPNIQTSLPRQINQIISDIQNEQADNITQLEWVYYLYAKTQWDIQNPEKSKETAEATWQTAKQNEWLKRRLFWRLALHYTNLETQINNPSATSVTKSVANHFPLSLVESFPNFTRNPAGNDGLLIQIIKTLQNQNPYDLAKLSWQYLRTPPDILAYAGLPQWLKEAQIALDSVAEIFIKNKVSGNPEVEWLLRCLKQMSPKQQVTAVEELLTNLSGEMVQRLPKLIEWLREQYAVANTSSQWHQLSDPANSALSRWIGSVNYGYFQQLVDLLARMLKLSDEERQQLEARRDFWANYSDRIQRIRLLLPQSSITALGYQLQLKVDLLIENASETTEICIFDFGHSYILEFLRGSGSEIRFVPRKPSLDLLLFGSNKLSLKQLRRLGDEVHDHVFLWQISCERWLNHRKIRPNTGIEYFKGLPKYQGKYNPDRGLPLPSEKEQKERDAQLKQWQRNMEKLQREVN
jgi:EH_Signature domain